MTSLTATRPAGLSVRSLLVRRLVAGVALAAAVVGVGCGDSKVLEQGTVIDKAYDDPDVWTSIMCVVYGKYGCTSWMPTFFEDPAHYELHIRGVGRQSGVEEWHGVDQATYHDLGIGDEWSEE